MEDNIERLYKGLYTDTSKRDQPKQTYSFALNAVRESEDGDERFISNEESNEICAAIPTGFTPIGKEYINKGQHIVFLTNPDSSPSDMIAIVDDECNFDLHVHANLNFQLTNQIDATFRLRRGCERVVYFVDGNNNPRIYNFDKPDDYKDGLGNWNPRSFNLFKTYNSTPTFDGVSILETGQTYPGSYNFSIQYLDEDFNPTEWITTTDTVIIYNDDFNSKPFSEVRGSSNKKTDYQDFGVTNKSIRLDLGNLDTSFPYYRIAIIEATNGSGEISKVLFSQEISTRIKSYTYTGNNAFTEGTVEEIQIFNNIITAGNHIEQIENRLVILNTKGKELNYCSLQKYASRIKADLVTEQIVLNSTESVNNQKRGQVHTEKLGYMPGEIYSFGIIYVFEDGSLSPVYHIPGRNDNLLSSMSSDNTLTDVFYSDSNNCSSDDYWGFDSQGELLSGQPVRHHRFPLRSEVGKSLYNKTGSFGTPLEVITNSLNITISGNIDSNYNSDTITYAVSYDVDGNTQTQEIGTLDRNNYNPLVGYTDNGIASSIGVIDNIQILERNPANGNYTPLTITDKGPYTDLEYSFEIVQVELSASVTDDSTYTSEIFGIKFYGIDLPDLSDTNGERIVSYYIVRNERKESDKTILDSGVMLPLLEEQRSGVSKFVAHGHLTPDSSNLKQDLFALIHPEHKFNGNQYSNTNKILKEGEFVIQNTQYADKILEDVQPGTSYDSEAHKRRERDSDGFSLRVLNRNSTVNFNTLSSEIADENDLQDVFYLDALFSRTVTDIGGKRKDVFNLSSDNKIGIVHLNKSLSLGGRLPYVVLKREINDSYSGYRVLPYFKETDNASIFLNPTGNEVSIFNGDSYISSMKYVSSMFYDIRLRDRDEKSAVLNYIIGVLSTIAGTVLVATGVGVAAGIALIGFGVAAIATGIKKDQIAKVYQDLYEQGLKDTVADNGTEARFGPNPDDDTIQWFHDSITDLWFESSVNMNWRMGATIGLTDFLNSPSGYDYNQVVQYCVDKLTIPDSDNDDGRTYQGFAKAEIYEINPDYKRRNKEKLFFHLGIEYDCCSKCQENFPHRAHYSEQSFQEELSDNYRVFLPNNYIDIEGETGEITNVFRIQNNLYIHTEEGLWHLPQNIQERITGDVTSFIGTGSFFSIPPRLIVDDDNGNSAGCIHKWATLKTPNGVFFISEKQGTIFQFTGNKLKPISSAGMFNWFKNNIPIQADRNYYLVNKRPYPYADNPSNPIGTGFISVYDSRKERVIFTKVDNIYQDDITGTSNDYEICMQSGTPILFQNFNQRILDRQNDGWVFEGIENCRMKFSKNGTETIQIEQIKKIPNSTDIHVFYDVSGSFGPSGASCLQSIDEAVDEWAIQFAAENPDWTGQVYKYNDSTERWVNFPTTIGSSAYGNNTIDKDILVISFCNESASIYHPSTFITDTIDNPTTSFMADYNYFVNNVYPVYKSFIGIHYPIAFGASSQNCSTPGGSGNILSSRVFVQHSIAALFGTELTTTEVNTELSNPNPAFTSQEWADLITSLTTNNPYPDTGLKDYGWIGKWDRAAGASGPIITPEQFNQDIKDLLQSKLTSETVDVEVPLKVYEYEDGEVITSFEPLNNSWTVSYSLKSNPNSWESLHSYLPRFYLHTPDKFQSWKQGLNYFWKHNKKYSYQNFYGNLYPFIVEYVSATSPSINKVWDYLKLVTEAKRYNEDNNEFLDERYITFNRGIFYNSRQTTGLLNFVVKDLNNVPEDYLSQQVTNFGGDTIIIDKNETDWTLNDLRDIRVNYDEPIFNKNLSDLSDNYYIDKVVNNNVINYNKDWTELESLRDKYLVVRLIFDNFEDIKLILNYSIEDLERSPR